jgi:hypothetical protein
LLLISNDRSDPVAPALEQPCIGNEKDVAICPDRGRAEEEEIAAGEGTAEVAV